MQKELTFIGLGRMGAAMSARLVEHGYIVRGFDTNETARKTAADDRITAYDSIPDALQAQTADAALVWLMVPAAYVDDVIEECLPHLKTGDTIIDGGNSFFKDSQRREERLQTDGIHFIDVGTSGGVDGARTGASLMIGSRDNLAKRFEDLFASLATTNGYGFVGGPGAGHFVKMIHNGIEYGMMGALAEGMNVLKEHEPTMGLDMTEALRAYEHGSIISSNLTSWLAKAYRENGYLEQIAGEVPRGETEMEMEYVIEQSDVPVLQAALAQRKTTREAPSYTGKLIAAMRNQFGGHATIKHEPNE